MITLIKSFRSTGLKLFSTNSMTSSPERRGCTDNIILVQTFFCELSQHIYVRMKPFAFRTKSFLTPDSNTTVYLPINDRLQQYSAEIFVWICKCTFNRALSLFHNKNGEELKYGTLGWRLNCTSTRPLCCANKTTNVWKGIMTKSRFIDSCSYRSTPK